MFDYIKDLIPVGRLNRPGNKMSPEYITIHDTANTSPGANALMHARYLKTVTQEVSWHYTVDDTNVIQHLPWNEVGWHAGTSQGNGNSIGIEICMNSDGDRAKAEENAQLLCVDLMKETGIQLDHIVQHNHWSGKNCPQVLRARANGWENFINAIYNIIHPPVAIGNGNKECIGTGLVNTAGLNLRSAPDADSAILGQFTAGDKLWLYENSNGWFRVYADKAGWVKTEFVTIDVPVEPVPEPIPDPTPEVEVIDIFKDFNKVSEYAKTAVQKAEAKGVFVGDENRNFNPQAPITRQDFAVVLDRLGLLE